MPPKSKVVNPLPHLTLSAWIIIRLGEGHQQEILYKSPLTKTNICSNLRLWYFAKVHLKCAGISIYLEIEAIWNLDLGKNIVFQHLHPNSNFWLNTLDRNFQLGKCYKTSMRHWTQCSTKIPVFDPHPINLFSKKSERIKSLQV